MAEEDTELTPVFFLEMFLPPTAPEFSGNFAGVGTPWNFENFLYGDVKYWKATFADFSSCLPACPSDPIGNIHVEESVDRIVLPDSVNNVEEA